MNRTLAKKAICTVFVSLFSAVPCLIDAAELRIYQSPEISEVDLVREIESLETIASIEIQILTARQKQTRQRRDRVAVLYKQGQASKPTMERAEINLSDISDELSSMENYRKFIRGIISSIDEQTFIAPEKERTNGFKEFQVRLPGLTLRNGGIDLFTARIDAGSATTFATKKYTATKLKSELAAPHKEVFQDFFGQRLQTLSGLSSARATELDRSQFHLSTVQHMQLLANHRFAARWRKGQRIEQYSGFVSDLKDEGEKKSYSGSTDSFWLFGDGNAVASTSGSITTADIHFAARKAQSDHSVVRAKAEIQRLQLRFDRLEALQSKGLSNGAELRETELALDLAKLNLKKAEALQKVAKCELDQLSAAAVVVPEFQEPPPVPDANGIPPESPDLWKDWLASGPTPDSDDLLRFFNLIKSRFASAAAVNKAQRHSSYEKQRLQKYRDISSVYQVELEIQQDRLVNWQTAHARALEQENLSVLQIQQWSRNVAQQAASPPPPPPGDVMEGIIVAGKAVNEARAEVANIAVEQRKRKLQYDTDLHQRLSKLSGSGAVNSYELAKAQNQMLRSKGALFTSMRGLAITKQEGRFIESLYDSGSMTFDEKGLRISRFMPEAVEELEKLTILKDSVDDGLILQYEAHLADSKNRIAELNRLKNSGYASKVELDFAEIKRKQLENGIALEKARGNALPYALALIRSLEFEPDNEKELKPTEDIKL